MILHWYLWEISDPLSLHDILSYFLVFNPLTLQIDLYILLYSLQLSAEYFHLQSIFEGDSGPLTFCQF